MPELKLIGTTTFRLVVVYLVLFGLSVVVILGLVYWFTAGILDHRTDRTISAELESLAEEYRRHGLAGLVPVIEDRAGVPRTDTIYLLASPTLARIAGNINRWPDSLTETGAKIDFRIEDTRDESGRPHSARAAAVDLDGGYHLLVGRDTYERDDFRSLIEAALLWALGFTLALGIVGGLLIARHMLKRIDLINQTTERITQGNLLERVPLSGSGDEFDQLAARLNAMLDRIGQLMGGLRLVTEGVAHDLRTPLTRLRSRLELALIESTDVASCHAVLEQTIADADRLLAIFTALLAIAEVESLTEADFAEVDLARKAARAVDLFEPVAADKGVALILEIPSGPCHAVGNPQLLSQALVNLIDNAIKYTPPDGRVAVKVSAADESNGPRIIIADNGPGIPAEERERVLQRFVRLDASRATPGNGLGLSLVDAVAQLHGAQLTLGDNFPGLCVTLTFRHEKGRREPIAEFLPNDE
ncbi:MAG: HAMP domain-containing protein [Azospirillum sp.]|nr:HAMP domain-containing protein [Azospirillum sp.]